MRDLWTPRVGFEPPYYAVLHFESSIPTLLSKEGNAVELRSPIQLYRYIYMPVNCWTDFSSLFYQINWETPLRSGLDEVPGPFSWIIASSQSGRISLPTDDGRGFESILARNQSTLKGLLIPSYYREFFFDFFSFHGLTSPRLPRKQIFLFLFFSINKIILYEDAEEIGILSPPKY